MANHPVMIDASSLSDIPLSFASPSLGMNPAHILPIKLRAVAEAGFQAVEIGMDDLVSYTRIQHPDLPQPHPEYHPLGAPEGEPDPFSKADAPIWTALHSTAASVRALCASLHLHILCLQPFSQYEGWSAGSPRRAWAWAKAQKYLSLASVLGAKMIQVGSNNDPESTPNMEVIAGNMARMADEAAKFDPPIKIAYEPWCWGVHINTWEGCWRVVELADRPNLGLCLDTFQIAGSPTYGADPTSPTGFIPSYTPSMLTTSLTALTKTVPPQKIFFFQISDGKKLDPPLGKGSEYDAQFGEDTPARQFWSGGCRPLPFAEGKGGYLPVVEVTQAVLRTGFRGWFSYEIFEFEQAGDDVSIPERYAKEGIKTHKRLMEEVVKA